MSNSRKAEWVLITLGVVAAILVVTDVGGPVRAVVTLVAWLLLPGWVVVRRLHVDDPAAALGLTVGASASFAAIIGMIMVWTHFWYPIPVGAAFLIISADFVILQPNVRRSGAPQRVPQ